MSEDLSPERSYATLLNLLEQGFFFKDRSSTYISVNQQYAGLLGKTPEQLVGRSDLDLHPPNLAEKYRADDRRVMGAGTVEAFDESIVDSTGTERVIHTVKSPVRDEDGTVVGLIGLFTDVTQVRQNEAELQQHREHLEELVADRTRELERGQRLVDGINQVLQETLACDTEEEVAQVGLTVALRLSRSMFGWVGYLNPAGRLDTIALAEPGWEACRLPESEKPRLIQNLEIRGIWGSVIRDQCSRVINDPPADADWRGIPEGHPELRCFMGIPLQRAGRVVGMISLANADGGYSDQEREDVEAFTASLTEALFRKRNEQVIAEQSREVLELSTPILRMADRVVVAPLIGSLDSERTQQLLDKLLNAVVETHASVALVDITGVPAIDTATAQHLVEAVSAVRLLGAEVILTGIRPAIAQTLVHLGIDLTGITTRASLASGLEVALQQLGQEIRSADELGGTSDV